MRVCVFTSNAVRHKFVANRLAAEAEDPLVISECRPNDARPQEDTDEHPEIRDHFRERYQVEKDVFPGHDTIRAETLPLLYKEANLEYTKEVIAEHEPEMGFVFGASILSEELIEVFPDGQFVNMHLGLSPYYRGSGTNFWPFVNDELGYIGATLLHLDPGIDTGDIVAHVRPDFEPDDTVHTVGNRVIRDGAQALVDCLRIVREGGELNRVPQWDVEQERYYRSSDFDVQALRSYKDNLKQGIVEGHLEDPTEPPRLVEDLRAGG